MLRLLRRRARVQWPLLAALLAVVVGGATLLGTCALLVTRTAEQALLSAASRAASGDVDVTAYLGTIQGRDAMDVASATRDLLTTTLAPFPATTATRAWSAMRSLPARDDGDGVAADAYLSGVDDLPTRARLAAGRWPLAAGGAARPAGPLEAVVLEPTAALLGLTLGSRVQLGAELFPGPGPAPTQAIDVTIVGIVHPLPGTGWERDTLAGAGHDPAYSDGRIGQPAHAYGPFLVDLTDLLASGSTIDRLETTANPDLSSPTRHDLDAVLAGLSAANGQLARTVGDRVHIEFVDSPLPNTLLAAQAQQQVTTAAVLVIAFLGMVLTATALILGGRLTAGVRADETALLTALGFGPRQLAAAATVEAAAIAVFGIAIAVPASSALHAGLTRLPPLVDAGLTAQPAVTGVQLIAVAVGALALAAVLVVLAVRPVAAPSDRHRREPLARTGTDLLLVAFAVAGWWQLDAQPTGASARVDALRVLAPTLLLTAGVALLLRLVPPALRLGDRMARRARGLVLPLAAFEAARRPQAVAAGLLIALACASGTFAIAFAATWDRSQHDQADLSVGTDLTLTLTNAPTTGQGAEVRAATGGEAIPVVDRGVAVGQWLGGPDDPPRLIAVDLTRAEAVLRGRLDGGRSWAGVGAALAPPTPAGGVAIPAGANLTITGTANDNTAFTVTPRLLLQDGTGLRTTCTGEPIPLDGAPHGLPACATTGNLRLVAVSFPITADQSTVDNDLDAAQSAVGGGLSRVTVTLTVPAGAATASDVAPGSPWTATSAAPSTGQLADPTVDLSKTLTGTELTVTTTVQRGGPYADRDIVATAFPVPGPVPVAVSRRLADGLGVHPGARLTLTVGTTPVPIIVTDVLPAIPAAPGAAAVLADLDALSRALVMAGDLDSPVDAWWVGRPTKADAGARATALRLGTVKTRAAETTRLTGGPLRAGLPAALRLLVPAAALLLLAGVVLHVTYDLQARALDIARLRGLGMYRREIRRVLLAQHAGVLLPLLAAGAVVGAFTTAVVAPLLVRSDTGALAFPNPLPSWPWATESVFLALLCVGCGLAVTVVVTVQARRADAAHLRIAP